MPVSHQPMTYQQSPGSRDHFAGKVGVWGNHFALFVSFANTGPGDHDENYRVGMPQHPDLLLLSETRIN